MGSWKGGGETAGAGATCSGSAEVDGNSASMGCSNMNRNKQRRTGPRAADRNGVQTRPREVSPRSISVAPT